MQVAKAYTFKFFFYPEAFLNLEKLIKNREDIKQENCSKWGSESLYCTRKSVLPQELGNWAGEEELDLFKLS